MTLGWVGYLLGALAVFLVRHPVRHLAGRGRAAFAARGGHPDRRCPVGDGSGVMAGAAFHRPLDHDRRPVPARRGALALSVYAAVRRRPGGLAFLLAFAPFVATVLLYQSGSFGFAQMEFLLSRSLIYVGIMIHTLILFGIILNRDATLRQERDLQLAEERALLERRVAERTRRLAEALAFNETVLVNSPLPMAVFAADGRCILANDALAEICGDHPPGPAGGQFQSHRRVATIGAAGRQPAALTDQCPRQIEINGATSFGKEFWLRPGSRPRCSTTASTC